MPRTFTFLGVAAATLMLASAAQAEISGTYVEARTCQVYTGPCFANGEVGMAGKEAVMAWNVEEGSHAGVDLAGLNVVMVVKADDTIGFEGLKSVGTISASVMVDERANDQQREALTALAVAQAGLQSDAVVRVEPMAIRVALDTAELTGDVEAGTAVKLTTRKARKDDCICSNESAYYPPLVALESFAAGVTIDGSVRARGLGSRWDVPGDRNVYMATFAQ